MVDFSNSDDYCGPDGCDLYINRICLDPLKGECTQGSCSLGEDSNDLDLETGLPQLIALTVEFQPWPVSEVTPL